MTEAQATNVFDFHTVALQRLRTRLAEVDNDRESLLDFARSHASVEAQVHAAVLAALDADGLDHLIHIITADWVDFLGLDAIALALVSGKQEVRASASGIQFLKAADLRVVLKQQHQPISLEKVDTGAAIFGPAATLVRAQALIQLVPMAPLPSGVLALGSRASFGFDTMASTSLLSFLGAVVERCLSRWMLKQP